MSELYKATQLIKACAPMLASLKGGALHPPNFEFDVSVSSGIITFDELRRPIAPTTSISTFTARVAQKKPAQEEILAGLNRNRIWIEGRLTDPPDYPYPFPEVCPARLLYHGILKVGTFYHWVKTEKTFSEILELDAIFGQGIEGFFEFNKNH